MNKSQIPLYFTKDTKTSSQNGEQKMKETTKEEKSQKAEIIYYAHV
jgi:hypothetical protein